MNSNHQNLMINIKDSKYLNWKLCLKNKLINIRSDHLEIDCKNLDLSCKDLLELIEIANQYNCKVLSFRSTSSQTIISTQSLGYKSNFIVGNDSKSNLEFNNKNINISKTDFHQGTIRSGEYLESPCNLLILGDVNPGAIVCAEGNIIIWGRLLGIAHAGKGGNPIATISALKLRPVQLRIANKIARGPKEKLQLGFAEQARIESEKIIISPLESI